MNKLVSLRIVCLTILAASLVVRAQETTAAIQGNITDPSGAVIANATVTLTGESLIPPATTTSDSHCFYWINALPSGTYTLAAVGRGTQATATNVKLSAGDLPTLNIKIPKSLHSNRPIPLLFHHADFDVRVTRLKYRRQPDREISHLQLKGLRVGMVQAANSHAEFHGVAVT